MLWCTLECLEPRLFLSDTTGPVASLAAIDMPVMRGDREGAAIRVTYSDAIGVDVASLSDGDLTLSWAGQDTAAQLIALDQRTSGVTRAATYFAALPDDLRSRTTTFPVEVRLNPGAVWDLQHNYAAYGLLGSLTGHTVAFEAQAAADHQPSTPDPIILSGPLRLYSSSFFLPLPPAGSFDYSFTLDGRGTGANFVAISADPAVRSALTVRRIGDRGEEWSMTDWGSDARVSLANQPAGRYEASVTMVYIAKSGPLQRSYDADLTLTIARNAPFADLTATLTGGRPTGPLVPGDLLPSVRVTNRGAGIAAGAIAVSWYASTDDQLDAADRLLCRAQPNLFLRPGASALVAAPTRLPSDLPPNPYYFLAKVDSGDTTPESDEHNNITPATAPRDVLWQFGNLPGRPGYTPLLLSDPDGTAVTFRLAGPGVGTVQQTAAGLAVSLSGTTTASTVWVLPQRTTAPTDDGRATLCQFTVGLPSDPSDHTSLGTLSAPLADLAGGDPPSPAALQAAGAIRTTLWGDIRGPARITLGAPADPRLAPNCRLTLGILTDTALHSDLPIAALVVTRWQDQDGLPALVTAPSIGALLVRGPMAGVELRTTGNVGAVTVGSLIDTTLFAGIAPSVTGLPATPADFATTATLGSLTLLPGAAFRNSRVAAAHVGVISFGRTVPEGPGGLSARHLARYSRFAGAAWTTAVQARTPAAIDVVGEYVVRIV